MGNKREIERLIDIAATQKAPFYRKDLEKRGKTQQGSRSKSKGLVPTSS
jgi:hypothetical protein